MGEERAEGRWSKERWVEEQQKDGGAREGWRSKERWVEEPEEKGGGARRGGRRNKETGGCKGG